MRPWRFSDRQMRALSSAGAWYPGLFRQMAAATSGITVEFETDASAVVLEVALDPEPAGTAGITAEVDRRHASRTNRPPVRRAHDGVSAFVSGRRVACTLPVEVDGIMQVRFELDGEAVRVLPGFGCRRDVCIHLPWGRGCVLRDVVCDGSYLEPVAPRPCLLALGDSITQGFVTDDPSFAWPTLVAARLGLDVLNQGVGGQVFQAASLPGPELAEKVGAPAAVIVMLGENYRFGACREGEVARDVRDYLSVLDRLLEGWGGPRTLVVTPLWHREEAWPTHPRSCYPQVAPIISSEVALHPGMLLVDGGHVLDHDPSLLADGNDHPNAAGAERIAVRLASELSC